MLQKFFIEKLNLTEKDFYNLNGCVSCPSYNHLTFFINNLDISDYFEESEKKISITIIHNLMEIFNYAILVITMKYLPMIYYHIY